MGNTQHLSYKRKNLLSTRDHSTTENYFRKTCSRPERLEQTKWVFWEGSSVCGSMLVLSHFLLFHGKPQIPNPIWKLKYIYECVVSFWGGRAKKMILACDAAVVICDQARQVSGMQKKHLRKVVGHFTMQRRIGQSLVWKGAFGSWESENLYYLSYNCSTRATLY